MTRMVFCKKYQKNLPGLPQPPYPGAKGKEIYEHVSAQAWQDWQKEQIMLINEKHLSMAAADDRKYLQAQMDHYFANEDYDTASGYVPPED
jgi:Fe-S cluster biosynthesis and repair protein YggX